MGKRSTWFVGVSLAIPVVLVGWVLVFLLLSDGLAAFGDDTQRSLKESAAFASQHAQKDCLPEAYRRMRECDGFSCEATCGMFLGHCLPLARPTPGFCEGVPSSFSPLDGARWQNAACERIGADEMTDCRKLAAVVQQHCTLPKPQRRTPTPAQCADAGAPVEASP